MSSNWIEISQTDDAPFLSVSSKPENELFNFLIELMNWKWYLKITNRVRSAKIAQYFFDKVFAAAVRIGDTLSSHVLFVDGQILRFAVNRGRRWENKFHHLILFHYLSRRCKEISCIIRVILMCVVPPIEWRCRPRYSGNSQVANCTNHRLISKRPNEWRSQIDTKQVEDKRWMKQLF